MRWISVEKEFSMVVKKSIACLKTGHGVSRNNLEGGTTATLLRSLIDFETQLAFPHYPLAGILGFS